MRISTASHICDTFEFKLKQFFETESQEITEKKGECKC